MKDKQMKIEQLQLFVDQVIDKLYQLPLQQRTTLSVLEVIYQQQQQMGRESMLNSGCDYISLAQVIDHLLQQLSTEENKLFWFCKSWQVFEPADEMTYTLENTMIAAAEKSVRFKKFFTACEEKHLNHYFSTAVRCAAHMFTEKEPIVEYVNLLTGDHKLMNAS
ncbi:hypothetical protein MUN89_13040 [Halobacillus salinarum]|uniref:Uncharacterized protein n=1 Tax=Halobacillus salinarum TaxID=2932257 RepID=A0ABY4EHE0_9BACI|nr:hypothetical protein [Halobacillus salinarum]UOQ42887.1 hypothetical protein MUN89_13040 [Halobacillus salinarum]